MIVHEKFASEKPYKSGARPKEGAKPPRSLPPRGALAETTGVSE